MKKNLTIGMCALIFIAGLGLMFYPTFSNWIHTQNASYAISDYIDQTSAKSNAEYLAEFAAARAYNDTLSGNVASFLEAQQNTDKEQSDYWKIFDQVNGIMGIVEIPEVDITLPIYHGTEETALQRGAGHLEGSALPTGDVGNHTVITGHTGLPTAELFTDLDELVVGDRFYLEILDQVFTYEVSEINVVLPSETDKLVADKDKDLVTLVTCTPYGVNSHRLLVRGERIEEAPPPELVQTAQADRLSNQSEPVSLMLNQLPILLTVALGCSVVFVIAIIAVMIRSHHRPSRLVKSDSNEQGD